MNTITIAWAALAEFVAQLEAAGIAYRGRPNPEDPELYDIIVTGH